MKEGSKYQPLFEYLRDSNRQEITLTFAEIEIVMNNHLPNSARKERAWWSNRTKGGLQAKAWTEAGYLAEDIDIAGEQVTFRKLTSNYKVERVGDTVIWNSKLIRALRRHMGMTQTQFANRLGVYQQTVSGWETKPHDARLSISKYLNMVAEEVGFKYGEED